MQIVYGILIMYLGMLWTSFGYVVAQRLPKGETLLGRSQCDHCKHPLTLMEVLPLFGYLFRKGRCAYCHQKISTIHPLLEIIGGLFFLSGYLAYGFSLTTLAIIVFLSVMIIETLSDIHHHTVIDRVWIIGLVPLIIIRWLQGRLLDHLMSCAIMFSLMFLIAWIGHRITKKEALGGGDVKLYLFIGFFLTWPQGLLSLFFASLMGYVYGKIWLRNGQHALPLVPFIFIGTLVAFFVGDVLIDWYIDLLRM